MKNIRYILAGLIVFMMQVSLANTEVLSDNEIKQKIIRFIAPVCAESMIDGELIDTYYINGNTNRLLRILSDMVKTNDEWICTQTMFEYSKYATKSELPFLYSCATNSMCGDRALHAILKIEGVTTNSLQALDRYMSLTNAVAVKNNTDRLYVCRDFFYSVKRNESLYGYKPRLQEIVLNFARQKKSKFVNSDRLLCEMDESYVNSKRRLSSMRIAVAHGLNEMQTNYVHTVIRSLEAFPEENLPE
jgi:hypothetical protein